MTARDLLTPLFFFRWRALIAFLVPVAIALFAAALAPRSYVADTRLLILLGDDYAFHSPLGGSQPNLSFDRTQMVKAETEIISSRELAEAVVQAEGAKRLYPKGRLGDEAAAELFRKDLFIDNVPQSNVVSIGLKNRDPVVAAEALNKLVAIYLQRRAGVFQQGDQASVDRQTRAIDAQLAVAEARVAQFAATHGFGDYQLELTGETNLQMQLLSQLAETDRQLADVDGKRSKLEQQKSSTPERTQLSTDYSRSLALDQLEQSLAGLQAQRRDANQQYVDGSPQVRDLDERIAKVQAQIATAPARQVAGAREGLNPAWQDMSQRLAVSRADLAGLVNARNQAAAQLQQANRRLAELTAIGPEYRELVRQRDVLETTAGDLAKRGQQERVENALSRTEANIRVLQAASPPLHGTSPKLLILTAGLVIGVVAAIAVVVLSAALFQGMLTPRDVEQKLALPVILTLNHEAGIRSANGRPTAAYLRRDDAEVIDHLLRLAVTNPHPAVQLIGPEARAGVTTLTVDYALWAANSGRRVLIIDTDPEPGRSAADLLRQRGAVLTPVGERGRVQQVDNSGLFLTRFRAGEGANTVSEEGWRRTLDHLRGQFDLVLVDTPPLSQASVGLITARCVSMTLAVIEAEESRVPAARNMIERITAVGGVVAAAIFNKRRFYIPKGLYEAL